MADYRDIADCRDIEGALERGLPLDGAGVPEHLSMCETCGALARDGGALARALSAAAPQVAAPSGAGGDSRMGLDAGFAATLEQQLEKERGLRGRLRALPTWARVATASLAGLLLVFFQPAREPVGLPRPVALSVLLVIMVAAVALLLRPVARAPVTRLRTAAVAAAALAVPFLLALGLFGPRPGFNAHWGGAGTAAACFLYGALVAAPFFVLLRAFDRWERVPLPNAVLFGAATGVVAGLVLELHCVLTHPAHVALGHATVGVLWAAAYAALSSRSMWRASH